MQAVWNKITSRGILQRTRAIELLRKEWQTTQLINCESNHLKHMLWFIKTSYNGYAFSC